MALVRAVEQDVKCLSRSVNQAKKAAALALEPSATSEAENTAAPALKESVTSEEEKFFDAPTHAEVSSTSVSDLQKCSYASQTRSIRTS